MRNTTDERRANMDHSLMKETRDTIIDIDIDINSCVCPAPSDDKLSLPSNTNTVDEFSPNNNKKEKRKSTSAKKAPKPPRPPRGFSLDAADQKLIKEISELAMIKRARIDRMKALKKMKAAKAAAAGSASSIGNVIAMVFTVIFCIVIIFQGCHSYGISPANKSPVPIPGSLELNGVADKWNLSPSGVPIKNVEYPNVNELAPGSDSKDEVKRGIH